jgi:23S rRNA (adenine2030-N6)-methyltransferase
LFSYRHAFHAGNHADVLKHAIFVHILDHFNRKEPPYLVIDTHAGAGIYDLSGDWATKNSEFVDGLDRVLGASPMPPIVERYLEEVQRFNPDGVANFYPGSPWLALHALRERDRLRLFEKHPSEAAILRQNLARQGRQAQHQTQIMESDGFDGVKALLPPPTSRALVIIDPSYEDKFDYRRTLNAVNEGLKRFATACFVIWYPLVQRREAHELARSFERLKVDAWVNASLTVRKPTGDGFGLHGSGVFVVNPPWTLHAELQKALPWLSEKLAMDDRAGFTLTQHAS